MKSFYHMLEDINKLTHNTVTNFDTAKRHNIVDEVAPPVMSITPDPENRQLLVKAKVPGNRGNVYDSKILFHNVRFKPLVTQMTLGSYLLTNPKTGEKFYLDKLSKSNNDVQVSCTCPDYTYTFAHGNAAQDAHFGDANPPAENKRNPLGIPGMCKHLLRVAQELEEKGILQ